MNDALDRTVARPVAKAYKKITPGFVQTGVSNFMSNAGYPTVIINDFLQAKFRDGFSDLGRFALNCTLGLGGLLDPATDAGLDRHDEDFGQTLGKWGVPAGAYIVLPLLGPSTTRDSFGLVFDEASDPRQYITNNTVKWGLQGLRQVEKRVRLLETDPVLDRTADKYIFVRSAFLQRREYQVKDGNVPDPTVEDMEDPDPGADSATPDDATPDAATPEAPTPDAAPAVDPVTPDKPQA